MLFFGILGYGFEKSGYPVSPIILGIILGPIMEINFRQALINTGSMGSLLISFVTRPLSLGILILGLLPKKYPKYPYFKNITSNIN